MKGDLNSGIFVPLSSDELDEIQAHFARYEVTFSPSNLKTFILESIENFEEPEESEAKPKGMMDVLKDHPELLNHGLNLAKSILKRK